MSDMLGRIVELVVTIHTDFRGVLVDLLEKLSGPNRMEWFEALKKFLRKEPCWVGPTRFLFLECEVGGKSKDELIAELERNYTSISSWAEDLMSNSAWTPGEKETVKFGRATMKELGFTHEPTWQELLGCIEKLGYEKCQPQDGPAIRLALKDQLEGDSFWCAMNPIAGPGGGLGMFDVGRYGNVNRERFLSAYWLSPGCGISLRHSVVFRHRK